MLIVEKMLNVSAAACSICKAFFYATFFSIHRFASPVVVAVASDDDDDEWPGGSPLHLHERSASLRWRLIILDKSLLLPSSLTPTEQSFVKLARIGSCRAASRRTAHRSSNSNMFFYLYIERSECGSQAENVKRKKRIMFGSDSRTSRIYTAAEAMNTFSISS